MEIKQVFIKSDNKFYNIRGHTDKLIIRLLVTCVQYNYRLQGVGYKTLFKLCTILLLTKDKKGWIYFVEMFNFTCCTKTVCMKY